MRILIISVTSLEKQLHGTDTDRTKHSMAKKNPQNKQINQKCKQTGFTLSVLIYIQKIDLADPNTAQGLAKSGK